MKDYLSLKEPNLMKGAECAYNNALLHFKAAHKLQESDKKFNGFANTHLIASIEEIIKSILLALRAKDRKFMNKKMFNQVFKKHDIKHRNFYYKVFAVADELSKEFDERENLVYGLSFLIYGLICVLGVDTKGIDKFFKPEYLEKVRLNGFYVDFDDAKNEWIIPSEQIFLVLVTPVLKSMISLVNENFIKTYNVEMADKLKQKLTEFWNKENLKND